MLSSFKIKIIFNNTSAEIKTKSADVLLKMTTILKEMRTAQLRSKNKRTFESDVFQQCVVHQALDKFKFKMSTLCLFDQGPTESYSCNKIITKTCIQISRQN